MDESDIERVLARVRALHHDAVSLGIKWSSVPHTPGWAGPTQVAALSQLHGGEELTKKLISQLETAEGQCSRHLHHVRAASDLSRGFMG